METPKNESFQVRNLLFQGATIFQVYQPCSLQGCNCVEPESNVSQESKESGLMDKGFPGLKWIDSFLKYYLIKNVSLKEAISQNYLVMSCAGCTPPKTQHGTFSLKKYVVYRPDIILYMFFIFPLFFLFLVCRYACMPRYVLLLQLFEPISNHWKKSGCSGEQ